MQGRFLQRLSKRHFFTFGLLAVFVWWVVDAFLLHGWIRQYNLELGNQIRDAA